MLCSDTSDAFNFCYDFPLKSIVKHTICGKNLISAKTAEPIEMPQGNTDLLWSKESCIEWGYG